MKIKPALLALALQFGAIAVAHAADPYDVLHEILMTREGPDGKSDTGNESTPAIFPLSDFPFGDKTFEKFKAALDSFEALPQEKIEAYSEIKRALMQRHLWKVFDATLPLSASWTKYVESLGPSKKQQKLRSSDSETSAHTGSPLCHSAKDCLPDAEACAHAETDHEASQYLGNDRSIRWLPPTSRPQCPLSTILSIRPLCKGKFVDLLGRERSPHSGD